MPVIISIQAKDVQVALKAIKRKLPELSGNVLVKLMRKARALIRTYPPLLTNQIYVRTGTYYAAAEFKAYVRGGHIAVEYKSDAEQEGRHYSIDVGGDAAGQGQALIHKGRWRLARKTIDEQVVDKFAGEFAVQAQRMINTEGL